MRLKFFFFFLNTVYPNRSHEDIYKTISEYMYTCRSYRQTETYSKSELTFIWYNHTFDWAWNGTMQSRLLWSMLNFTSNKIALGRNSQTDASEYSAHGIMDW